MQPAAASRPIILLGASWRTGSTLVQRLISAAEGVLIWGEGAFFHRFANIFRDLDRHFSDVASNYEALVGGRPHLEWIAVSSPPPADYRAGVRAFMDRVYADTAARLGFERWGIKDVRQDGVHAARLMGEIYPDAKFVFLVRDPFATLASALTAGFFQQFPSDEAFVGYWKENTEGFLDPERVGHLDHLLLRYEDLIGDTKHHHPQLSRLMDHLELPVTPAMFKAMKMRLGGGHPGKLTAEQVAMVARVTAGVRQRLAYDVPS